MNLSRSIKPQPAADDIGADAIADTVEYLGKLLDEFFSTHDSAEAINDLIIQMREKA
jgi:hypothetical protein